MEIIGKIIQAFPEVSGMSQAGKQWKKREYVLETMDTYPRKIFFDFFNDRADLFPLQVGQDVKLTFEIESREWTGANGTRWFTSVRGIKAEAPNAVPAQPAPAYQQPMGGYQQPGAQYAPPAAPFAPAAGPAPAPAPTAMPQAGTPDDLPF